MNKSIVCGVLVRREDKFLLVKKQPNIGPYPNMWTGPGGHVEEGETLDECVVRELYEETGHMSALAYLADYAEGEVIFRHADLPEYRWVTYDEAQSLPLSPTAKYFFELAHTFDPAHK